MHNFKLGKDKYLVLHNRYSLTNTMMWSHYLLDLFMEEKDSVNYFRLQGWYKDGNCIYHSVLATKTTMSYLKNK